MPAVAIPASCELPRARVSILNLEGWPEDLSHRLESDLVARLHERGFVTHTHCSETFDKTGAHVTIEALAAGNVRVTVMLLRQGERETLNREVSLAALEPSSWSFALGGTASELLLAADEVIGLRLELAAEQPPPDPPAPPRTLPRRPAYLEIDNSIGPAVMQEEDTSLRWGSGGWAVIDVFTGGIVQVGADVAVDLWFHSRWGVEVAGGFREGFGTLNSSLIHGALALLFGLMQRHGLHLTLAGLLDVGRFESATQDEGETARLLVSVLGELRLDWRVYPQLSLRASAGVGGVTNSVQRSVNVDPGTANAQSERVTSATGALLRFQLGFVLSW